MGRRGEELVEAARVDVDLLLVREPFGHAAQDAHRAEGDDERRELHSRDEGAGGEPRDGERGDPAERRDDRIAAGLQEARDHHSRQRDARADREIDPAVHDDERHADRGDRDDHRLPEHRDEVRRARERVGTERGEEDVHGEHRDERPEPAWRRSEPFTLARSLRRVPCSRSACSVHSPAGARDAEPAACTSRRCGRRCRRARAGSSTRG